MNACFKIKLYIIVTITTINPTQFIFMWKIVNVCIRMAINTFLLTMNRFLKFVYIYENRNFPTTAARYRANRHHPTTARLRANRRHPTTRAHRPHPTPQTGCDR